jgi:hypothetical protein
MKEHEKDPRRRETLAMVIAEIGSNSIAFKRRRTAQGRTKREGPLNDNRDNVVPLFGSGKPSDPKKYIDCNLTATVRTNETKYSASTRIPFCFLDSALSEYFRHAGDRFAEESAVFSTAVRCVLASEGHLSNKAIILWLIQTLEATHDVVQADVIRKTLEIVVGYTMDDL